MPRIGKDFTSSNGSRNPRCWAVRGRVRAPSTLVAYPRVMDVNTIVGAARTLQEALVRLRGATPSWSVVDVVIQDEYSHDVVLRTSEGRWVSLDVT